MSGQNSLGLDFTQRLLGMKAVEGKFITEKQYTQCLNIIDWFEKEKTLTDILIEKEFMTHNQIKRLQKIVDDEINNKPLAAPKKESSFLFGGIALGKSLISEIQLDQALEEQEKYRSRGVNVQIGQILLKKGYITLTQISFILESQAKKTYYCKKCSITTTVDNAKNEILQCTECGLDLVETKKKKTEEEVLPALNEIKLF